MNPLTPFLVAGLTTVSAASLAQASVEDLSYGFIEADYINLDIDQSGEAVLNEDFDNGGGFGVHGSLPLGDLMFVVAAYSDTRSDFAYRDNTGASLPGDTSIHRLNLNIGFILPIAAGSDLAFSGGYADIDYGDFDLGASPDLDLGDLLDDPNDGYSIDARYRAQFNSVEGSVGARYAKIEDIEGVSLIGNVMFEITQHWGLNLNVDAGSELLAWGAGIRYSF